MTQSNTHQPSEHRREADAAFQQSLVQLETLIEAPAPPEAAPIVSEDDVQWDAAGADLEEFLDVDDPE
ncbi:MAG: hypothetical protein AAGG51_13255 [Cyanobacteria bacterium P01_G01_bin.54]